MILKYGSQCNEEYDPKKEYQYDFAYHRSEGDVTLVDYDINDTMDEYEFKKTEIMEFMGYFVTYGDKGFIVDLDVDPG